MLLPEFELYGIKPSGGALDAASTCVCAKKPSSKVRKSLDMYVSWNDSLKDPRSRKLVAAIGVGIDLLSKYIWSTVECTQFQFTQPLTTFLSMTEYLAD